MTLFGLLEVSCRGDACLSHGGVQRKRKDQYGPCYAPSSQQPHSGSTTSWETYGFEPSF